MLIGFSFRNFKSFHKETIFSMEASTGDEFLETNSFKVRDERFLKSAVIFGPNASGKTNWVEALAYMRDIVLNSVVDNKILKKNEAFKFYNTSEREETSFEISFLENEIIYDYGFSVYSGEITKEWLRRNIKRSFLAFERNSPDWESIELIGEMKQAEKIKKFTRKDSLFLTTASNFNISFVEDIINWFSRLNILFSNFNDIKYTAEYLEKDIDNKKKVLRELKIADLGISDFDYELKDLDDEFLEVLDDKLSIEIINEMRKSGKTFNVHTNHLIYDDNKEAVGKVQLPFVKYQSEGTIRFFEMLGPILESLEKGEVLIIDEIDSRLHSGIVTYILELFNSIDRNPKNSQLICNSHNILLLDEKLRRDQLWFVEKNIYGESELYCLDDFTNVRKDDLRLKKYLLGVYGAFPNMVRSQAYE